MIRADLHCHTSYSHDCFADVAMVLACARQRALTHLAITDHDTIDGALRARDQSRHLAVVVGCEVSLADGAHLIGLFLERRPTAKSAAEVIDEIHAQGGFVCVPHPFHPRTGLLRATDQLPAGVDAIEACSGYEPPTHNQRAAQMARHRGLPLLAGSDAHYGVDIGRACVEFPEADGPLTPEVLRRAARTLYTPIADLAAVHARDAEVRADTLPRLRQYLPAGVRRLVKRAHWLRVQRQIAAACREPVRKEFAW